MASAAQGGELVKMILSWPAMMNDQFRVIEFSATEALLPISDENALPASSE